MIKLLIITGPTGVGKTEISIKLAQKLGGEIINADSRQFYREMVIGTARPDESQFRQVPHHLFGISDLNDPWDAARFQKEADSLIADIDSRNRLPIIVGGTGLYIRALLYGLFSGPAAQGQIRQKLEGRIREGELSKLYGELKTIDPEAAGGIHPNDAIRVIRALEVYELTGLPISAHQKSHQFKKNRHLFLKLGVNRERPALYQLINKRVDLMIADGLELEVKNLWKKYDRHPILERSIGYKEWFPYFRGEQSLNEAIELIKQHSRNFAKRQLTWFRQEKDIVWFDADDWSSIETAVSNYLQE